MKNPEEEGTTAEQEGASAMAGGGGVGSARGHGATRIRQAMRSHCDTLVEQALLDVQYMDDAASIMLGSGGST